jgi:hypothetical protein
MIPRNWQYMAKRKLGRAAQAHAVRAPANIVR